MNKLFLAATLSAALLLTACDANKTAETNEPAAPVLDTLDQKVSYFAGFNTGEQMKQQPFDLNLDNYIAGLTAAVEGADNLMTEEEIKATMEEFQTVMSAKQEEQMAAMQAERAEANAVNVAASEAYLATNKEAEGVVTTESGLQYKILTAGTGAKPTTSDKVKVHYEGTLIDGTVFDSSIERGSPVEFGVTQVIPGWTEVLQLMPQGSKWEVYIHPSLAYGENGPPSIGPGQALIFQVELLEINSGSE